MAKSLNWPKKGECGASIDWGTNKQSSRLRQILLGTIGKCEQAVMRMCGGWGDSHRGHPRVNLYLALIWATPKCWSVAQHHRTMHYPHLTLGCCSHVPQPMFSHHNKAANALITHWNPMQAWSGTRSGACQHWCEDNACDSNFIITLPKFSWKDHMTCQLWATLTHASTAPAACIKHG